MKSYYNNLAILFVVRNKQVKDDFNEYIARNARLYNNNEDNF